MQGVTWYLLVNQQPTDARAETTEFEPEMMMSEDSSMGIVGTLHRWENGNPKTREVWVIEIEKGVPVVRKSTV